MGNNTSSEGRSDYCPTGAVVPWQSRSQDEEDDEEENHSSAGAWAGAAIAITAAGLGAAALWQHNKGNAGTNNAPDKVQEWFAQKNAERERAEAAAEWAAAKRERERAAAAAERERAAAAQQERAAAQQRANVWAERMRMAEAQERERAAAEQRERAAAEQRERAAAQERERATAAERLPVYCRQYNSGQGCNVATCHHLHLCKFFLANICKNGNRCCYDHSLNTAHNKAVCERQGLDTRSELASVQKLRRAFEENAHMPEEHYRRQLQVCFKFGSAKSCHGNSCNRLHMCRNFVAGNCTRRRCRFGHSFHTTYNDDVLIRHKASMLSDSDILDLLRQKYSAPTPQVTRVAAAAGAEAGPGRSGTDPRQACAPDSQGAIAEELQCPVCLEMFNRATTLGCGHTFCAGCLKDVHQSGGDDRCPMCRTTIASKTRSVALDNIIRSMRR